MVGMTEKIFAKWNIIFIYCSKIESRLVRSNSFSCFLYIGELLTKNKYVFFINAFLYRKRKSEACRQLGASASRAYGLLSHSARAYERNSVVAESISTRVKFL